MRAELGVIKSLDTLYGANSRIKDSIINSQRVEINLYKNSIGNLNATIGIENQEKANLQTLANKAVADLKKANRKVAVRTVEGIVVALGLSYLLIKK